MSGCCAFRSCNSLRSESFRMQICADTMIGNQLIRGISGGQKKRVTTGQILLLQHTEAGSITMMTAAPLQQYAALLLTCFCASSFVL